MNIPAFNRLLIILYVLTVAASFVYPPWIRKDNSEMWVKAGYHHIFTKFENPDRSQMDNARLLVQFAIVSLFYSVVFLLLRIEINPAIRITILILYILVITVSLVYPPWLSKSYISMDGYSNLSWSLFRHNSDFIFSARYASPNFIVHDKGLFFRTLYLSLFFGSLFPIISLYQHLKRINLPSRSPTNQEKYLLLLIVLSLYFIVRLLMF